MNLLMNHYSQWLAQNAGSLPAISPWSLALPTILIAAALAMTFGLMFARAQVRAFSSIFLVLGVINLASFQSCSQSRSLSEAPPANNPLSPTINPDAMDLVNYFNNNSPPNPVPLVELMKSAKNPRAIGSDASTNSEYPPLNAWDQNKLNSFDLANGIHPDCLQLNLLAGVFKKGTSEESANKQCTYVSHWENQGSGDSLVKGVRSYLEDAKNDSSGQKRIVFDLSPSVFLAQYQTPTIFARSGEPFAVLAYYVDSGGDGAEPEVKVLNPQHLRYDIVPVGDANLNASLSVFSTASGPFPGWFQAAFGVANPLENVRPKYTINPSRVQTQYGHSPWDEMGEDLKLTLAEGDEDLPQSFKSVSVVVLPRLQVAGSPEAKAVVTLSDQWQSAIRPYSSFEGPVNLASGEVRLTHLDSLYPLMQQGPGFGLSVGRSYSSFMRAPGSFGYGWTSSLDERKRYYSLQPIIGADLNQPPMPMFESGDGRLISIKNGPYWGEDPQNNPEAPDFQSAKFFYKMQLDSFNINGLVARSLDPVSGNPLYRIYSGNKVVAILDHFFVSSADAPAQRKQVISQLFLTIDSACQQLKAEDAWLSDPAAKVQNFQNIVRSQIQMPGNFAFFCYEQERVKVAAHKDGFFSWYVYNEGNQLAEVKFFSNSSVGNVRATHAYTYHSSQYLSGHLQSYTHVSGTRVSIDYSWLASLIGEFPVATQVTMNDVTKLISYDPKNKTLPAPGSDGAQDAPAAGKIFPKASVVVQGLTDEQSATHYYFLERLGYVSRIEGPTETSNKSLLFQAFYNLKNLHVIASITRGVKSIVSYKADGGLERVTSCSAFDREGNFLPPALSNGLCPDESLKRTITYQGSFFPSYRASLDVRPIGLGRTLPGMTLPAPTSPRVVTGLQDPCFGTLMKTVVNKIVQGGSVCSLVSRGSSGGYVMKISSDTRHPETGLLLRTKVGFAPSNGSNIPDPTVLTAFSTNPLLQSSQVGFWNKSWNAYSSVFTGSNYASNHPENIMEMFFDPRGNIIASRDRGTGVETYSVYDYSFGVAKLVTTRSKHGAFLWSRPETVALWNDFSGLQLADGTQYEPMVEEIGDLHRGLITQEFLTDNRYNDRGQIQSSFLLNGDKVSASYDSYGQLESTDTYLRKSSSASSWLDYTVTRDPFGRPTSAVKELEWGSNLNTTTYTYRSGFDRGLDSTTTSRLSEGLGTTTSRVIDYHPETGYPLVSTTLVGGVDSSGPKFLKQFAVPGPFGETLKTRTESYQNENGSLISAVEASFKRDPSTGALYESQSQQVAGLSGFDNESYVTRMLSFHPVTLRPRSVVDVNLNLERRELIDSNNQTTKSVWGPSFYRLGGARRVLQTSVEKQDGCGNPIMSRRPAGSSSNVQHHTLVVNYSEKGLPCAVLQKNDLITGWWTRYHYTQGGQVILTHNDRSNGTGFGFEASVNYNYSYKLCASTPCSAGLTSGSDLGTVFSWSIASGKGQNDAGYWTPKPTVMGAVKSLSSSAGTFRELNWASDKNLYVTDREFHADNNFFKMRESAPSTESNAPWVEQTLTATLDETKYSPQRTTQTTLDPLFQQPTYSVQTAKLPGQVPQTLVSGNIYDLQGRLSESRVWTANSGFENPLHLVRVDAYQKDKAKEIVTTRAVASGSWINTTMNSFWGDLTVESVSTSTDVSGQQPPPVTKTSIMIQNGIVQANAFGMPLQTRIVNDPATNSNGLGLQTSRSFTYDEGNRLKSSSVTLGEVLAPNNPAAATTMSVPGQPPLSRQIANGRTLNVSYVYQHYGYDLVLQFDGRSFRYAYNFTNNESVHAGRLKSVAVSETTNGVSNPVSGINVAVLGGQGLYPAQTDLEGGQVAAPDGLFAIIASWFFGPSNMKLNNLGKPKVFGTTSQGYGEEKAFSGISMAIDSTNLLSNVWYPGPNQNYGSLISLGFQNIQNSTIQEGRVDRSRTSHLSHPVPNRSCDQLTRSAEASNTRWGQTVAGLTRDQRFDAQGRLSYAQESSQQNSGVWNYWFSASVNNYFNEGYAGSDNVVRYKNPNSANPNLQDWTAIRAYAHRVWTAPVPALGGQTSAALAVMIRDTGQSSLMSSGSSYERGFNNAKNTSGLWILVPGPSQLPLAAFFCPENNPSVRCTLYRVIRDPQGNARAMFPNNELPTFKLSTMPFGTVVRTDFEPTSLNSDLSILETDTYFDEQAYAWSGDVAHQPMGSPPDGSTDLGVPTIFGPGGNFMNVLGHVMLSDGSTYDPYTGRKIELVKTDESICNPPSTGFAAQAQFAVQTARGRKLNPNVINMENSYSASADAEAFIAAERERLYGNQRWVSRFDDYLLAKVYDSKGINASAALTDLMGTDFSVTTQTMGFALDMLSNDASGRFIRGDHMGAALGFLGLATVPLGFSRLWSLQAVDLAVGAGNLAYDLSMEEEFDPWMYADDVGRAAYGFYP